MADRALDWAGEGTHGSQGRSLFSTLSSWWMRTPEALSVLEGLPSRKRLLRCWQ